MNLMIYKQLATGVGRRCFQMPVLRQCSTLRLPDHVQSHQESLPRLPVPPLAQTLNKYLETVHPLVSPEEFDRTKKIVGEFSKPDGLGQRLHSLLEQKASTSDNWLTDWWLRTAYLEFRQPVVVYSSPGLVFPPQKFRTPEERLQYAARMVAGILDYDQTINRHSFPLEQAGSAPLDMAQYYRLLGTCRIPHIPTDALEYHSSSHIVVCHRNNFFELATCHPDGTPLTEGELLQQLREIEANSVHSQAPIGVLTAEHRDRWAKAFKTLCKDHINKESVRRIRECQFLLCLDDAAPPSEDNVTSAGLQAIHGGGADLNSGNRWFDKTIQLIVGADGVTGLNYEHSPAEGQPIARMADHMMMYMDAHTPDFSAPSSLPPPVKLPFHLSPQSRNDLEAAKQNLEALIKDLQLCVFVYRGYGKDFIKSQKLSPDSFIQMALQLSYYRLHGVPAATYESASTRMFLHGRTETIRSCSTQALDFCRQWLDHSADPRDRIASLRTAVEAHKKYAVDSGKGLGVDRYLLGLRKLAAANGIELPAIFQDRSFETSAHFRLSTSQVASQFWSYTCYGPGVPDGYGCCYNPFPRYINFAVSAFRSSPETDAKKLEQALETSLAELHQTLSHNQQAKL